MAFEVFLYLQVLEENYKGGRLRSIGVSNYTVEHLHQLLDTCTVPPHVLQVNSSPNSPRTAYTPGGGAPALPAEGARRPLPGEEHSCPGEAPDLLVLRPGLLEPGPGEWLPPPLLPPGGRGGLPPGQVPCPDTPEVLHTVQCTAPVVDAGLQVGPPEGLHGAAPQLQPRSRQGEPTGRPQLLSSS